MADKGAGKERHADLRGAVITVLPFPSVKCIHKPPGPCENAERHPAADDFAIAHEVGADAEKVLSPLRVGAETEDNFIKDQRGACLCGDAAQFLNKPDRRYVRAVAGRGDRFDQDRGNFAGVPFDDFQ